MRLYNSHAVRLVAIIPLPQSEFSSRTTVHQRLKPGAYPGSQGLFRLWDDEARPPRQCHSRNFDQRLSSLMSKPRGRGARINVPILFRVWGVFLWGDSERDAD